MKIHSSCVTSSVFPLLKNNLRTWWKKKNVSTSVNSRQLCFYSRLQPSSVFHHLHLHAAFLLLSKHVPLPKLQKHYSGTPKHCGSLLCKFSIVLLFFFFPRNIYSIDLYWPWRVHFTKWREKLLKKRCLALKRVNLILPGRQLDCLFSNNIYLALLFFFFFFGRIFQSWFTILPSIIVVIIDHIGI